MFPEHFIQELEDRIGNRQSKLRFRECMDELVQNVADGKTTPAQIKQPQGYFEWFWSMFGY
jgi:hypothetical protein